jgi:hypothetical protein
MYVCEFKNYELKLQNFFDQTIFAGSFQETSRKGLSTQIKEDKQGYKYDKPKINLYLS